LKAAGNQLDSKARGIYLMRESRHRGLAFGIDSQKQTSVDTGFRALCDFIFFKSTGIGSLPDDLKFVYRFLNPLWLRNMEPYEFGILSGRGR
jgi:hypothetical protein